MDYLGGLMKLNKWIIGLILTTIFIGTYLWFIVPLGLPTGVGLEKSDWLSFWSSFLSFSGTIILGIVAWQQTKKANATAEEAHKLSEKMLDVEFERNYPYVIINKSTIFEKETSDINIEVFKKDLHRISKKIPTDGEYKGAEINTISIFFYDEEQDVNKLKEFVLNVAFQNYSETIIQSIKVEKVVSNLFFKEEEKAQRINEFIIEDSFQLSESNAIMPYENMYFDIIIASNYEFLNNNIFKYPTSFKILIRVNTLRNSYLQEISLDYMGAVTVPTYKFNLV